MGTSFFNKLNFLRRFVTIKTVGKGKPTSSKVRRLLGPVVVDLFAGCGGLSAGLELAGFHPVYVNELVDDARESYLLNRDHLLTGPSLRERFNSSNIKGFCQNSVLRSKLDRPK
ncbi:MAG: DNA cytosine methyltransferase [Chloroflexi bacterium]|nr:DNA cytosine methyltransferase [Chloroflexota bacterium]